MEPKLDYNNRDEFIAWLVAGGAVINKPKVQGEFVRFTKPSGKQHTIMTNRDGTAHINGGKLEIYARDFLAGIPVRWTLEADAAKEAASVLHKRKVNKLAQRDGGMRCVYCGRILDHNTATLEHVVPKSKGGPDNDHNLVLACRACNAIVGNMPVSEKIARMQKVLSNTPKQRVPVHIPKTVQDSFPNARIIRKADGTKPWLTVVLEAMVGLSIILSILVVAWNTLLGR